MTEQIAGARLRKLEHSKSLIALKKESLIAGLPHLYGWGWYTWAWDFFHSRNPITLLVAGNQVSKSSSQIRKCIEWAGNKKLWPELWKTEPKQFWYLYPDKATATREWRCKWEPEFMPRGEFKDHPTYGWTAEWGDKKQIARVVFNSGVTLHFMTYAQDVQNLQSSSVHAIFTDEELPVELYDELQARLYATDGYFSMVFTATRNQDFWLRAMEGKGDAEVLPDAFKLQVSMRDCFMFRDGSPGAYNEEKVRRIELSCRSETERQRRVEGRFVTESGRKYPQFDGSRHYIKPHDITGWHRYAAVDSGSGGEKGHPPGIVFIAARPDYRRGVVYKAWKGDDGQDYTSSDIFDKFLELRGLEKLVGQCYDYSDKDFFTIAERAGETFMQSDKGHDRGENEVNTLFKNDILFLWSGDNEIEKLGGELASLMRATPKRQAKDDLADACRYCVVSIPWDYEVLTNTPSAEERREIKFKPMTDKERLEAEIAERRGEMVEFGKDPDGWSGLTEEFEEWNTIYGT